MTLRTFFLSLCCLLLSLPLLCRAELVDRSVAIVNQDIITLSEVNEIGQQLFRKAAAEVPPEQLDQVLAQIRSSLINKLVDQKLLLQEAERLKITVSDQEVDRAIERILAKNRISRETFLGELATIGMDEKQYRQDLHGQILRSKLVNYEVRFKVIIPEEKIIDFYDQNYTQQVGSGGYYILQIGTSWKQTAGPGAREEAETRILKVRKLALEGENFKELARNYSELPSAADGGDLGIFQKNEMAPFMRNAVIELQPGEVSQVVETPSGFQIFSLLSRQEGQIITKVPYESVKEEIRETLYEQEMQSRYQEWIKGIKDKAYIKIL
ncbi:peptidylprolyl isomerase [Desulfogranum mediterraneum]|uniref:peptidylprolyl isomerase n=1 Tax=Desulfogranum mediterraneum TaxID=160661 RepID=UPI00041B8336|nr:peptidylprolyl isomerase [Desulfogranum mediterraneum]